MRYTRFAESRPGESFLFQSCDRCVLGVKAPLLLRCARGVAHERARCNESPPFVDSFNYRFRSGLLIYINAALLVLARALKHEYTESSKLDSSFHFDVKIAVDEIFRLKSAQLQADLGNSQMRRNANALETFH